MTPPLPPPAPTTRVWVLLFSLGVSAAVWSQVVWGQWREAKPLLALDIVLGVAAYVVILRYPQRPFAAALATGVLASFSGIASGPQTLMMVQVGARRKVLEIVPSTAVFLASAYVFWRYQPLHHQDDLWYTMLLNVVLVAGVIGWGVLVGQQRDLVAQLTERAERAEVDQAETVEVAKTTERQVIAREMHDVLAHRITQLSMTAGAMAYRDGLTAEELRAGAATIQTQANEALADLRGVLGVLRDPGTGEPIHRPQPKYDDIATLLAEAQESGVPIELINTLSEPHTMSTNTGRTLYRILQEAVTNARKHAAGLELRVELYGAPSEGVGFLARNQITPHAPVAPGAGLGLVGLTERAQLLGGRLSAATRGNVFELRGWLPWQA